jgi:predicted DNA binding CopG/RHH family protein
MDVKLTHVADGEMDEEESERFTEMERQADLDAERAIDEQREGPRWSPEQVELIRRAAAVYGIPYRSYLKQAAVRQALADLNAARAAEALLKLSSE